MSYNFVSEEEITSANNQFLHHNYPTDIITFDFTISPKILCADILVCPDVVKRNANELHVSLLEELNRVIIHGILHLVGFDDANDNDILQMRNAEDQALILLHQILSSPE